MKTDPKATGKRSSKKSKINDQPQRSKIIEPMPSETNPQSTVLNPTDASLLATYQHAPIGLVECSLDARYIHVNAEFCRMLGYEKNELLTRSIRDVTYSEDAETDLQLHQKLINGEIPIYKLQKRFVRKDGEIIWAEVTRSLMRGSEGEALYSIGVILDITEQKQAEVEIENISRLPAENPNPIMRLTPDGEVLYANEASADMLNFWKAELQQAIPKELQKQLKEVFDSGAKKQIELEEKSRVFSCTLVPIPEAGYINFYSNDVTAYKATEQERNQLLEREQAERAKAEQARGEAEQAKANVEAELSKRKFAETALGKWTDEPLPDQARPLWLRYGMATVVTIIAILMRQILNPMLGDSVQFTSLFGAIAFSVWYGGIGPALFAAIFGYVGTSWLIMDWQNVLSPTLGHFTALGVFLISSMTILALGEAMRRAQRQAHQSARVAVEQRRQAELRLLEQQRIEEVLRESERKFSLIYHNLPFAAALSTAQDSTIIDVNTEFEKIFGYSKAEAMGKSALELGINPDRQLREHLLQGLRQHGSLRNLEIELSSRSGEKRLFLANNDVVSMDNHNYILTTLQDITERKQAEEKLHQTAEFDSFSIALMDALRPISDPLQVEAEALRLVGQHLHVDRVLYTENDANNESTFVADNYVNGAAKVTGRISLSDFPVSTQILRSGQVLNVSDMHSEMNLSETDCASFAALNVAAVLSIPILKDGRWVASLAVHQATSRIWNQNEISILQETAERIWSAVERARAQQALTHERELLQRLFDTMPAMVSMIDLNTQSMQVNAEFERVIGWKADELSVVGLLEALYPDPEYRQEVLQRMSTEGLQDWIEVRVQTRDGRALETMWSNISIMNDSQLVRGVAIGIDITERKHAENSLAKFAREQEALYLLTDQLQRAESLDEIYNAALEAILNSLQCDRASILLTDEANVMHFAAWRGLSAEYRKFTDGHSPWQPDTKDPKPVYYNDIDSSDLGEELCSVIKAEGISSLAFIPLVSGGKLIGKFMTYFNAPHQFTETELDLSLTVARQLTFGIERERAAEQLHDSEDRLRLAVAAGQIGIWDIDLIRRDRTWSKEGKAIYGLAPDEFLDFPRQLELTHPDDRASVDQAVRAFRDEGTAKQLNLEHRIVHSDGTVHWVEVRGEAVYEEDTPRPVRLIGTIVDITERKQHEQQLAERARLLDLSDDAIFVRDPQDRITYWNRGAEQIYGWKREEALGKVSHELLQTQHPELYETIWETLLRDGAWTGELVHTRRDGTQIVTLSRWALDRDAQGQLVSILETNNDITERKKAEQRLILLASFSELLRKVEDPRDLMYVVSKAVGDHLQVRRCLFNEIDIEQDIEIVHRDYCRGVPSVAGIHKVSEYSGVTTAEIASGKTIVNHDSKTDPRTAPDYQRVYGHTGERAYIAVPMMREQQWVATLWVSDDEPRHWSPEDVSLLESIAERTWVVIEKLRIDEALRASERLYRTIARNIPNGGIYVVDKDMRYLVAEGPVTELFGFSRTMLEGRTVKEVFGKESKLEENIQLAFAGQTVNTEAERNGRIYWSQYAPLTDSLGQAIIVTLDITERKRAEEALRSSEERMRLAIEANRMVAWEWDPVHDHVITSDNFAEVYGLPSLNNTDRGFSLIWPEDLPTHREKVNRITRQGGEYESEFRITRPVDGRVLWMEERATAMTDTIGRVTRLVGVVTDITERKRAEEELRQSEERERVRATQLAAIMEAVPAAIWIAHDPDCKVVTGNRTSYEILRMSAGGNASLSAPEENRPTNFEVIHEGQILRPDELPVQRAARGNEVRNFEEEVRFDDGTSVYLFGSAITLRDERNNPTGALAAFVDITARKQAEQLLKQLNLELEQRVFMRTAELSTTNEQLLEEIEERAMVEEALRESDATTRLILDTSPDVIVITNKQGRIMNVNAQIKGLFGHEASEVLGQPIEILIPQRFHERHLKHRADYSSHPHRRSMGAGLDLFGQRKDGSEFPIDAMLTPIQNQNISDWETMITIRDSTERKRMETEIRENQKRLQILSQRIVEVQEEERRTLARELHDRVGQSLAALSLNLTIINNQLVNQANEQVNERLSDSIHLTKEVIALVRDVMANLRPTVLDDYGLEVALKANLDDLKSRYGLNVKFENSGAAISRLNPSIEMTLLRITQEAFLNIIRHAHADQVSLALGQVSSTIRLTIEDNGVGIQSFAEANRPGSHGLTIMRERAEAVGGHLRISSPNGKGTKIEITVPFQPNDRKDNQR